MRRVLTPEHRAKIALALHNKPKTAKTRAKMSAAKAGKRLSPQHKASISNGQRARWAEIKRKTK